MNALVNNRQGISLLANRKILKIHYRCIGTLDVSSLCCLASGSAAIGAAFGILASRTLTAPVGNEKKAVDFLQKEAVDAMPRRIILVRHGESQANADHTLYRTKADNLIELTEKGSKQAIQAGIRIKKIVGNDSVHIYVSPFERTLQTARNIQTILKEQVIRAYVTPQIREQEFGNLQGADFYKLREDQKLVGRFWYRFPTGESGADVYDRVMLWWERMMLTNLRPNVPHADSVVVVTHGIGMRLILMQLYGWSPTTFHTIWNAGNCDMYVLRKDINAPAGELFTPYVLDTEEGDVPASSVELHVEFMDGSTQTLIFDDYLSIQPPRTMQFEYVCKMLSRQHHLDPTTIKSIDFFGAKFKKFC